MKRLFRNAKWGYDGAPLNLLVEDGKVAYRGEDQPQSDAVEDLSGAYVLPGFVDCHCHILPIGLDLQKLNLYDCQSREEVGARVQKRAAELPENEWLLAVQYDANRFPDGREISATELDRWTGGRPADLRHSSGHSCVANSAALRLSGIDGSTPDPRGGRIVRNEHGAPTGLLEETAMNAVSSAMPPVPRERMVEAILTAAERMNGFGITAASDMMTGYFNFAAETWAYRTAMERGCTLRIRLYVLWRQAMKEAHLRKEFPDTLELRIAGAKIFADGAIGPATAAMFDEFQQGGRGSLIYEPKELQRRMIAAENAGYALAVHSIGDRSTEVVLDALEACKHPSRHRIEHAMLLSNEQIKRLQKLRCRVVCQPGFMVQFGDAYKRRLGDERAARIKPLRTLLKAGIAVALSSDAPVVPGDPWTGINAAAQRPDGFDPTEAIPRSEAVRRYTEAAAEAQGDGRLFGGLRVGQWADFQVYDQNPMPGRARPAALYVGGERRRLP
ncbi:MAG: amidohydrolase [Armatimonadetes bacterium]|nr:amidohydrolase [Armatimonadota bacterium]